MAAAPPRQLSTPKISVDPIASVDEGLTPPEIIRFNRGGTAGNYYQALGAAAQVRLRLLGTLHARGELGICTPRESARQRLAAQQNQAWRQLQWLVAEMQRLDDADSN